MASVLKVDKLDPQSGTALEIGTSGDTITVPSGATFAVSGTMNASSITAGTVATARLGSGTASSSTVLYGDQTYKAEPGLTGWTTGGTSNSLIPSATDQGIYLGVSSATAANLLDDYEEGTWTPVLGGSGGTSGQSYGGQGGKYVKIGNVCYAAAMTSLTAKGTITGGAQIQGFPFAVANSAHNRATPSFGYIFKWGLDADLVLNGIMYENNTYITLLASSYSAEVGSTNIDTDDIIDATEVQTNIVYQTA